MPKSLISLRRTKGYANVVQRNTRGKQRIRNRYSWRIRYFGVTEGRIIRKKEAIQRKSRQKNH